MKESVFQKKVIEFLKENNAYYVKYWAGSQYTRSGVPDILACIDGTFHGIELKTDVGEPTKLQLYNIAQIKDSGGQAYILRPKDFESWKGRWFK